MPKSIIASRYAHAFFSFVSDDRLDQIDSALSLLATVSKTNADMQALLSSPGLKNEDKVKILDELLGVIEPPEEISQFVRLLLIKKRLVLLPEIAVKLHDLVQLKHNSALAEVSTAYPFSEEQQKNIIAKLEALTNKNLELRVEHDESLIAGLVVRINNKVYDLSLRRKIKSLKKQLASE